jgi:hypothetical protein
MRGTLVTLLVTAGLIGTVWVQGVPARNVAEEGSRDTDLVADAVQLLTGAFRDGSAIPAWSRKYNVNCSHCHYPAVPRLNATGQKFKWAGFRLADEDEIGAKLEVTNVSDHLAVRTRLRYSYDKTEDQPVSSSQFELNDVTLFAAGPFSKNLGAFLELEHAGNEVELVTNMLGIFGPETNYGGVRAGQFHWLVREGLAGFDRPTGISTPTPLSGVTTGAIPFRLNTDQLGAEAFYVLSGTHLTNRLSFEVLNGVSPEGRGAGGSDTDTKKDLVGIEQLLYDDLGSGLTLVGYRGAIEGLIPEEPDVDSHFWRFAASANKFVGSFEILAGYVYSKDEDLPVGAESPFTIDEISGDGLWFYGGYTLPNSLTLFGRYEFVDPNGDVDDDGNNRFVIGGVLPVSLPEYLRLAAEYTLDDPQASDGLKRHRLQAEAMFNF